MGPLQQLLLCLLCSGILKSASQHLRMFSITENTTKRTCSDETMNLVTLYDDDDVTFVTSYNRTMKVYWVGLQRKEPNMPDRDNLRCPTNGDMKNCSEKLNFVCEKGSFVHVQLNWCSARQYCHYHLLGDLATDGDKINQSQAVWIGGDMTDDWVWEDGGCSVFSRDWKENPSNNATFAYLSHRKLTPQNDATQCYSTVCSKGDFRIMVVNATWLTWEGALEYCDSRHSGLLQIHSAEDQEAVEEWLTRTTYKGTFWVGLRQSRVFGFWIWKDRMVNHSNWENGSHPEMPLSHPCGVIETPSYKWTDHNCLHPLPFICEERIVYG